jgi:hypothetical protein
MGLWSRPGESRHGETHLLAVERLKDWTRARIVLTPDETVLVTENPTSLPGYPPIETLVAFWTTVGTRHLF